MKNIVTFAVLLKDKLMETITFTYNAQNAQARNLLNYIFASGLLIPKIEEKSGLAQAFDDVEKGRVYHAIRNKKGARRTASPKKRAICECIE
jgi:hypothetical protein